MGRRELVLPQMGILTMPICTYNRTMTPIPSLSLQALYRLFIKPHSASVDDRRREFILNVLLSGLFGGACVAVLSTSVNYVINTAEHHVSSLILTFLFWAVVSVLLMLSRRGNPKLAALIFVGFLLLSSFQFAFVWGFGLAVAELMFALTIVITGVLFAAPLALVAVLIVSALILIVSWLQVNHIQTPQTYWQQQSYQLDDAIAYIVIFIIIGVVSWLSNRETDRSLQRARASEAALQKERDNLESKVIDRTRELEDLQLARLLELQPFAEFGRIGAGLVHEIANPLTAAALNLEELNKQQHSVLVRQLQRNLSYLERYLVAARKQIKRESKLTNFAVGAELKQIINLLNNRARKAGVELRVDKVSNIKLYGDVVKFNQLVANLIANAIDASEGVKQRELKIVTVTIKSLDDGLRIAVNDHGPGISTQAIEHLFEPFYSTKKSVRSGLGIGLALVKQYVEQDFGGTITVVSERELGTTFTIQLRGYST